MTAILFHIITITAIRSRSQKAICFVGQKTSSASRQASE